MAHRYRGKSLKDLREQKNLKLRWISEETRITTWYLAGIEEEHFDRFPGKFYFKSFTGQYARELGLNESEVVRDLQSAYDAWEEKQKPVSRADRVSISDGSILSLLHFSVKDWTSEV